MHAVSCKSIKKAYCMYPISLSRQVSKTSLHQRVDIYLKELIPLLQVISNQEAPCQKKSIEYEKTCVCNFLLMADPQD